MAVTGALGAALIAVTAPAMGRGPSREASGWLHQLSAASVKMGFRGAKAANIPLSDEGCAGPAALLPQGVKSLPGVPLGAQLLWTRGGVVRIKCFFHCSSQLSLVSELQGLGCHLAVIQSFPRAAFSSR